LMFRNLSLAPAVAKLGESTIVLTVSKSFEIATSGQSLRHC